MTSGSLRPSPLVPSSARRTSGDFFASRSQKSTTSAWRDVAAVVGPLGDGPRLLGASGGQNDERKNEACKWSRT